MTVEEATLIHTYVQRLARHLELRDWRFYVDRTPCDEDCAAQVEIAYGQRHATIRLTSEWSSYTPEKQRQTLTHELIHCHLNDIQQVVLDLAMVLGHAAYHVVASNHHHRLELATEALANALAPHLPLPPAVGEGVADA